MTEQESALDATANGWKFDEHQNICFTLIQWSLMEPIIWKLDQDDTPKISHHLFSEITAKAEQFKSVLKATLSKDKLGDIITILQPSNPGGEC